MRTVSSTASLCLPFGVLALAAEIVVQQRVVVGVEQNAHRGAVAHVGIEADDGDVVDDGRAHHAGDLRFADGDLLLEPLAVVVVDALVDEHVAEVALPMAHEVAEPEVVREVAEAHVEAFVRDVRGEGLDGSGECGGGSGEIVGRSRGVLVCAAARPLKRARRSVDVGSGIVAASFGIEVAKEQVAFDLGLVFLVGQELRDPGLGHAEALEQITRWARASGD